MALDRTVVDQVVETHYLGFGRIAALRVEGFSKGNDRLLHVPGIVRRQVPLERHGGSNRCQGRSDGTEEEEPHFEVGAEQRERSRKDNDQRDWGRNNIDGQKSEYFCALVALTSLDGPEY